MIALDYHRLSLFIMGTEDREVAKTELAIALAQAFRSNRGRERARHARPTVSTVAGSEISLQRR